MMPRPPNTRPGVRKLHQSSTDYADYADFFRERRDTEAF